MRRRDAKGMETGVGREKRRKGESAESEMMKMATKEEVGIILMIQKMTTQTKIANVGDEKRRKGKGNRIAAAGIAKRAVTGSIVIA